jgi:hypothetical protein
LTTWLRKPLKTDILFFCLCDHFIEILVLPRRSMLKKTGAFFSAGPQPILCCKERFCWALWEFSFVVSYLV